jgi:hypothetical protein
MMRRLLQSALCLILCPLLVAQQVAGDAPQTGDPQRPAGSAAAAPGLSGYAAIPEDTRIELTLLDSDSLKSAKAGSYVLLAVARNVVVDGVTVLRAGTCLTATTTGERRGSHTMNRNGNLTIRAWELQSGRKIRLRIKGMRSEDTIVREASWDEPGPRWMPGIAPPPGYAVNGHGPEAGRERWIMIGFLLFFLAMALTNKS